MNLRCLLLEYSFSKMDVQPSDLTNAFGLKETGLIQINSFAEKVMHVKDSTLKQILREVQLFY